MHFTFSESAKKDISKLQKSEQSRLKKKLLYWEAATEAATDTLGFAKPLTQHQAATHRFRFGSYRLIVKVTDTEILVLRVRHRKDVYKR